MRGARLALLAALGTGPPSGAVGQELDLRSWLRAECPAEAGPQAAWPHQHLFDDEELDEADRALELEQMAEPAEACCSDASEEELDLLETPALEGSLPAQSVAAAQMAAARAATPIPKRRTSEFPGCQASKGPRDDPAFLDQVRPCGNFSSVCTDIPLIEANKDYPGGGVGAVIPNQDYVVQFDIGIHPVVARDILRRRLKEVDSCLHCPVFEERCFEIVVTGGAMWGNLGLAKLSPRAYDCMGGCGVGCANTISRTREDIGALDCLKHDVCSAWKSVRLGHGTRGFCHDPDCGDEAAMSIFNCWRGWRLFGSLGGNRAGLFSEPVVCERDPRVRGCWSHSGWFTQGRCKAFQGWERGQGIPDPDPLRSPFQRL